MTTKIPTVTLNDGVKIPVYGFGTFRIPADGSTYKAVREALDLGIRHIDTAVAYFNEAKWGKQFAKAAFLVKKFLLPANFGYKIMATKRLKRGLKHPLVN